MIFCILEIYAAETILAVMAVVKKARVDTVGGKKKAGGTIATMRMNAIIAPFIIRASKKIIRIFAFFGVI